MHASTLQDIGRSAPYLAHPRRVAHPWLFYGSSWLILAHLGSSYRSSHLSPEGAHHGSPVDLLRALLCPPAFRPFGTAARTAAHRIAVYHIAAYRIVAYRIAYRTAAIAACRIVPYRIVTYRIAAYRTTAYHSAVYRTAAYRIAA
jgi:hypothetical protein